MYLPTPFFHKFSLFRLEQELYIGTSTLKKKKKTLLLVFPSNFRCKENLVLPENVTLPDAFSKWTSYFSAVSHVPYMEEG